MEEMQNLNVEETVTEMVEVATDKLTFKENCVAYVLAGVFVTGLTTIGYLGYKGTKKLANKIRDKSFIFISIIFYSFDLLINMTIEQLFRYIKK